MAANSHSHSRGGPEAGSGWSPETKHHAVAHAADGTARAAAAAALPHHCSFPDLSVQDCKISSPSWLFRGDGVGITSPCIPAAMQRCNWHADQFVLHKQLYRSDRSKVFHATDQQSGIRVALKLYRKNMMVAMNRMQVEREVSIQMQLDHENIIQLFAAFSDERNVYLVQEFADGGDLFKKVQAKGSCCSEEVVQATISTFLNALQYLHQQEIIHRDIKPENILLTSTGAIKLTDFGLAINLSQERPVTRLGTLEYMAPEVLRNPDKSSPLENKDNDAMVYTTQVDIWATGILTYELLVGRAPFEQDTYLDTYHSILHHDPILPPWLSKRAKSFTRSALCKNALKRPTIGQLLSHPWLAAPVGSGDGADAQQPAASTGWMGREVARFSPRPLTPVKLAVVAEPEKPAIVAGKAAAVAPLPALLYRSSTLDLRADGPSLLQILESEDLAHERQQQAQARRAASPPPWAPGRPEPLPKGFCVTPPRRSRVISDQGQPQPLPTPLAPPPPLPQLAPVAQYDRSFSTPYYLAWQHGSDDHGERQGNLMTQCKPLTLKTGNRVRALDFEFGPRPIESFPEPRAGPTKTVSSCVRTPEYGARRDVMPELTPVKHCSQGKPLMLKTALSASYRTLDCTAAGSRYNAPDLSPRHDAPARPQILKTISSSSISLCSKALELGRKLDFMPDHLAAAGKARGTALSYREVPSSPRGCRSVTAYSEVVLPRTSAHDFKVEGSELSSMFGPPVRH